MRTLRDKDFSVIENEKKPYILFFSGHHCPNCKEVEKHILEIEKDKRRPCKFAIYKIIYEDSPELVSLFLSKNGIKQIPTTFFIKNKSVSHVVGSKKISEFVIKTKELCKDEPKRFFFKYENFKKYFMGDD